jgi:hypothetical protein
LLALLGVVMLLGLSPSATAEARVGFCGKPVVRDYERPLKALPPVEALPEQLPFAPGVSARVSRFGAERLMYLGDSPYYYLSVPESAGRVELNWTVRVLTSRVEAGSPAITPVAETTTSVGAVSSGSAASIVGGPLSERGSFRIDVTFSNQKGEILGSYAEYVQAVPRTFQVRLGLSRQTVRPGGTVKARLENLGTESIGYGYPYSLERYRDGGWVPIPRGPFLMPLFHAPPGTASRCDAIRIPERAAAGVYRVGKTAMIVSPPRRRARVVGETFRVVR